MRNDELTILCDKAEEFKGLEEELNRKQHDIWITVKLSGNDERAISDDKMRVQDIYNCLRARPGRDHYYLIIENGEWAAHLTPSDNTMSYTPEVREELLAHLKGLGEVKVAQVER